jgi:GIY-YIG catalytic domain
LVDGQPQKVDGGSFYLEWVEAGVKRHRSLATLDPFTATEAKAELESELRLLFGQSFGFTRQPVEPLIQAQTPQAAADVFGYVYKVTHKASGRVYIGQTRNMVILRWREHARSAYAGRGSAFQKALREYGAESFVWETIASGSNQAELDAAESRWIVAHQATDPNFGFGVERCR